MSREMRKEEAIAKSLEVDYGRNDSPELADKRVISPLDEIIKFNAERIGLLDETVQHLCDRLDNVLPTTRFNDSKAEENSTSEPTNSASSPYYVTLNIQGREIQRITDNLHELLRDIEV